MSDYAICLSTGFVSYDVAGVKGILRQHFGANYPKSEEALEITEVKFGYYQLKGQKGIAAAFFQRLRYSGLLASHVEDSEIEIESGEIRMIQSAIITCKQLDMIRRLPDVASLLSPLGNLASALAERINQEIFSGYTGGIEKDTLGVIVNDGMPVCSATFCITYTALGTKEYGECHSVVKATAVGAINKILGLGGRGPKVEEVDEVSGVPFTMQNNGATHKIRVRLPLAGLALQVKADAPSYIAPSYIALSLVGRARTLSAGKIAALRKSHVGVEMISISQSFPTIRALLSELCTTLCAVIAFRADFDAWDFPQLSGSGLSGVDVIAEIIAKAESGHKLELRKIVARVSGVSEIGASDDPNDSGLGDDISSDGGDEARKCEVWFSHDPVGLLEIFRGIVKAKLPGDVQEFVAGIDKTRVVYDCAAGQQKQLISVGEYKGLQPEIARAYCDAAMKGLYAFVSKEEGACFMSRYDEARNGLDKKEKKHIPESVDVCSALLALLQEPYSGKSSAGPSTISGLLVNAILNNLGQFIQMVSCSTKDKTVWVQALYDIIGVFFVDVLRVVKNIIQAGKLILNANYCSFASDENGDLFATTILTAMEIVRELQVPGLLETVGFDLLAPKLQLKAPRTQSVDRPLSISPEVDDEDRSRGSVAASPPPIGKEGPSSTAEVVVPTTLRNEGGVAPCEGRQVDRPHLADEARPAPVAESRFVPPEAISFGLLFGLGCVLYNNREPLADYSPTILVALLVAGGVRHVYSKKDPTMPNPNNLFSGSDHLGTAKEKTENATAEPGLARN